MWIAGGVIKKGHYGVVGLFSKIRAYTISVPRGEGDFAN